MKKLLFLALTLAIVSCQTESSKNFTLKGNIKGLKKGNVYLLKQQDTIFKTLDSLTINGDSNFELHADIEEPEVLFLRLNKNSAEDDLIAFFADKGLTEIHTTLKNFTFDAKINGSKQQVVLEDYLNTLSKINNRNLEQIKENFEAYKNNDTTSLSIQDSQNKLIKQKYSYTINFALNNKDSEVAPYLAVYEVPNTSIRYLDTIYNSLEDNIKTSLYGKELKAFIEERKKENN